MDAEDVRLGGTAPGPTCDETVALPDRIPTATVELAWSSETGDTAALPASDEHKPLPRSLQLLLVGVCVGQLVLWGSSQGFTITQTQGTIQADVNNVCS